MHRSIDRSGGDQWKKDVASEEQQDTETIEENIKVFLDALDHFIFSTAKPRALARG